MVNYGIQTAALVFPSLNLEVRVNVELRDILGCVVLGGTTDEVVIAKIETTKAVAELMHYELVKELRASGRSLAPSVKKVLKGCHPAIVHHDQLAFDFFREAIAYGEIEALSHWSSTSVSVTPVARSGKLPKGRVFDVIWE